LPTLLLFFLFVVTLVVAGASRADEAKITSALSAGPDSLTKNAAVHDWDGTVLREGTNGWTCLPDIPDNGGTDPWCLDPTWLSFIKAMQTNTAPPSKKLGIGYMLAGDAPVSNINPSDKAKTDDNQWVEGIKAHLMVSVPDPEMLGDISDDPNNGGPWIMWANTPYVHVMVPIDSFPPG
jgi:hypothetical protein